MVREMAAKISVTVGLMYAGLAIAVITIFLPWVSVSVMGIQGPSSDIGPNIGWKYAALLVIAAAVWLAWPTVSGSPMPANRLIGLTVAVCLLVGVVVMGFFVILSYSSNLGGMTYNFVNVSPGFGLYLYAATVIAIAVGVVRLWLEQSKTPRLP